MKSENHDVADTIILMPQRHRSRHRNPLLVHFSRQEMLQVWTFCCVFITISDLWWTSLQLVSWYLIKYFNFFWKICWNIFKAEIFWRSVHGSRGGSLLVHSRDSTGREAVGRHDDLLRCWGGGGGACWQEEGRQEVQEGKEMQGKRKGKRFAYLIIPRSLTAFCR